MTRLRTGAIPTLDSTPASDPIEVGARARENASVYAAWLNAGKPREVIEAEQRERRQRRADAMKIHTGDG